MKSLFEHIEQAKQKPYHVRKKITFSAAALASGLIALVWFVGNLSLGAFAIKGSTFAADTGQTPTVTSTTNNSENIAGAAAAFRSANAPAHIEIVDTATSTPVKRAAEQTTIPF